MGKILIGERERKKRGRVREVRGERERRKVV